LGAAIFDDPSLPGRELEEHLDLEGGHFARQVSQTQKCRAPYPYRRRLCGGRANAVSALMLRAIERLICCLEQVGPLGAVRGIDRDPE
jgi:hypothetical protein